MQTEKETYSNGKFTASGEDLTMTDALVGEDSMAVTQKKADPQNWYENFFKMAAFVALIVGVAWWAATTHSTLNQIAKQNEDFKEDARLQKLADQESYNLMVAYLNDVRVKIAAKGLVLADPPKAVTKEDIKKRLGR